MKIREKIAVKISCNLFFAISCLKTDRGMSIKSLEKVWQIRIYTIKERELTNKK